MERRMDTNGRLCLPKEYCRILGLSHGSRVDVTLENGVLKVKKSEHGCIFCGSNDGLLEFKESRICANCRDSIKNETLFPLDPIE